ncbi:hypothetical protein PSYPI_42955, partial [Pseudomonas syringae pv. pisi str. 1704B]
REALVIELPDRFSEEYQDYFDDVEGGCFNESKYINDLQRNIEAAGLKAACQSELKTPEPECLGCGTKGYTGNCSQCIPY